MLCLLTLLLMWAQAIAYVSGSVLHGFPADWIHGVTLVSAYILAIGLIHWLMSLLKGCREAVAWEAKYNALRTEDKVVEAYTKEIPVIDIDRESCSSLLFGRPDASRSITVFSNPYCGPCAELHSLIDNIPSDKVNVQYVMTFFSDDLSKINRYIIAAYRQLGAERTWRLMSDWFAGGRTQGEAFFAPYGLDPDSPDVESEFRRQQRWREIHKFPGTPTVLFNGKEIRRPYSVIDYMYLPL